LKIHKIESDFSIDSIGIEAIFHAFSSDNNSLPHFKKFFVKNGHKMARVYFLAQTFAYSLALW